MASSKGQKSKVKKVLSEFAAGKLVGNDGKKVTSRKQAMSIAMSEAGLSKKKATSAQHGIVTMNNPFANALLEMANGGVAPPQGPLTALDVMYLMQAGQNEAALEVQEFIANTGSFGQMGTNLNADQVRALYLNSPALSGHFAVPEVAPVVPTGPGPGPGMTWNGTAWVPEVRPDGTKEPNLPAGAGPRSDAVGGGGPYANPNLPWYVTDPNGGRQPRVDPAARTPYIPPAPPPQTDTTVVPEVPATPPPPPPPPGGGTPGSGLPDAGGAAPPPGGTGGGTPGAPPPTPMLTKEQLIARLSDMGVGIIPEDPSGLSTQFTTRMQELMKTFFGDQRLGGLTPQNQSTVRNQAVNAAANALGLPLRTQTGVPSGFEDGGIVLTGNIADLEEGYAEVRHGR